MKYVTIPHTNLSPSQICLGTNRFGSVIGQGDAFALLDTFVEHGGNFLDTAHVYANWIPGAPRSASEKTIGQWLKTRNIRSEIVIGTKGGHPDLTTMHRSRLSPAEILQDVEESLHYLQTDYIDLYWLHRDDPAIPVADLIEPLHERVRDGKIKYFGCSNWTVNRMIEALDYARKHRLAGFVANQPMWSLAAPNVTNLPMPGLVDFDPPAHSFHQKTGIAVVPYSSQAQGFFTKMEQKGVTGLPAAARKIYLNETNVGRFEAARRLALRYEVPVAHIVLSYLISQPFTTIPVVACRTLAQLTESMQAIDLRLEPEELRFLEEGHLF